MITDISHTYQIRKDQDGFPHRGTATRNTSNLPLESNHQRNLIEVRPGTFQRCWVTSPGNRSREIRVPRAGRQEEDHYRSVLLETTLLPRLPRVLRCFKVLVANKDGLNELTRFRRRELEESFITLLRGILNGTAEVFETKTRRGDLVLQSGP